MRWGLFLLGAGLAALGVSLTVLGVLSYPVSVQVVTDQSSTITLPANSSGSFTVSNVSGVSGAYISLEVQLHSSYPVEAWLTSCPFASKVPPSCVLSQNTTASTDLSLFAKNPHLPIYAVVHESGNQSTTVTMSAALTTQSSRGLPDWEEVVILAGAVVLLAGGTLASFLGIFLRGNLYGPPPEKSESEPTRED